MRGCYLFRGKNSIVPQGYIKSVFIFGLIFQAMSKEERMNALKNMAEECAKQEKSTADETAEVLAQKMPTSKGGKCIYACIGETLKVVSWFTEKNRNSSEK